MTRQFGAGFRRHRADVQARIHSGVSQLLVANHLRGTHNMPRGRPCQSLVPAAGGRTDSRRCSVSFDFGRAADYFFAALNSGRLPMSSPLPTLDTLRREIDEIDDAIHNLLMRRCRLVEQIGRVKANSGPAMKPAREAMILRRLAARHEGDFPIPVLLRMWREMLAGTKLLQGPLAVAVGTQDAGRGLWDMARDHYGSTGAGPRRCRGRCRRCVR